MRLNIPVGEILRELQEEWMWNEKDIAEIEVVDQHLTDPAERIDN